MQREKRNIKLQYRRAADFRFSFVLIASRRPAQAGRLFSGVAKWFGHDLMVIFENDVSWPFGRDLGYPITVLLENDDQCAHLGDVLDGRGLEPGHPCGPSAVVALGFSSIESRRCCQIGFEPGQQAL